MTFPSNPSIGDTHTEEDTLWTYGNIGWYRSIIGSANDITYTSGGGGSATAAGSAGEIQYTDGTNLAASPNLLWDSVNDELEVGGDIILDDGGTYNTTLQMVTPTADRTISFPDATGTVGLVAGSNGQVIYNSSGANAGLATVTTDGTNVTLTGRFISSLNGAASAPPGTFTGTWFTGGTATTTKPQVLIEPSGTTSTAWSTSGTGLGVNAASGFAGNLLDLQVNGTSRARVTATGNIVGSANNYTQVALGINGTSHGLGTNGTNIYLSYANYTHAIGLTPGGALFIGTEDNNRVLLYRDAADTLAQRNGTNAQTFRCYGTFTDASNYVRAALSSTSTAVTLAAETAGTGADDIPLNLTAAGTGTVKVNSVAEVAVSSTVAGLPAAPAVGMLTRVTDATAPAVGSIVAGGGAAAALVWYNGANWTVIGV